MCFSWVPQCSGEYVTSVTHLVSTVVRHSENFTGQSLHVNLLFKELYFTMLPFLSKVTLETLRFGWDIKEAIDYPRIHHQLFPQEVQIQKGFPQVSMTIC